MYTPLHEASLKLNIIKERLEAMAEGGGADYAFLIKKLRDGLEAFEGVKRHHRQFSSGLPDFLNFYKYPINDLIQRAINDWNSDKLKEDGIEITFKPQGEYDVYCSLFLQEHIYNILNNSVYSIRERKKSEPDHEGRIALETSLVVDDEEKELNQRCRIRVVDNGIGLEKSSLSKIPNPFSTKPSGTGFGLSAAFQYVRSIGGRMEVDSEAGKFFEVNLYIDVFSEEVHGKANSLSALDKEVGY